MAEKYGRKVRELMVKEIKDTLSGSKGFVFASVENIKASEIDQLRKTMRQAGTRYVVIKNRLAKIALKEAGMEGLTSTVEEEKILGVGIIKEEPVQIAKLMTEFSKKNKGFNVENGFLEGRVLTAQRIKELAALPGREQLIAMAVGMIKSPISNFVGVLSSTLRSLLYALNAVKDKKESA